MFVRAWISQQSGLRLVLAAVLQHLGAHHWLQHRGLPAGEEPCRPAGEGVDTDRGVNPASAALTETTLTGCVPVIYRPICLHLPLLEVL
jgi:hypothetical protein